MKRPSKKEIQAAVDKLKDKPEGSQAGDEPVQRKLEPKKAQNRIRKKGV